MAAGGSELAGAGEPAGTSGALDVTVPAIFCSETKCLFPSKLKSKRGCVSKGMQGLASSFPLSLRKGLSWSLHWPWKPPLGGPERGAMRPKPHSKHCEAEMGARFPGS